MQTAKLSGQPNGTKQLLWNARAKTRKVFREKWTKRKEIRCADSSPFDPLDYSKEIFGNNTQSPRVTLISSDWVWSSGTEMNKSMGHSRCTEYARVENFHQQGGSATFYISAWNGVDPTRRLCLSGFCLSVKRLLTSVSQAVEEIGGEIASYDKENRSQVVVELGDSSERSCKIEGSQEKVSEGIFSSKAIAIDQYAGKRIKTSNPELNNVEKEGVIYLNASEYGVHEHNFTTSFVVLDHVNLVISLPMLWGIPPTHRVLKPAIRTAGGVVEKVSHSWKLV